MICAELPESNELSELIDLRDLAQFCGNCGVSKEGEAWLWIYKEGCEINLISIWI